MEKKNETTIVGAAIGEMIPLPSMPPDEQRRALWRREGICQHYSEEKRRWLIFEASNDRIRKGNNDASC